MRNAPFARGLVLLYENSVDTNDDLSIDHNLEEGDGLAPVKTSAWLYIAWAGLLVCIVFWWVYACRSCFSERSLAVSKEDENVLPDEERRLRLRRIFEERGAQMAISKDSLISDGSRYEEGSQQSAASAVVDEESGKSCPLLVLDKTEEEKATKESAKKETISVVGCCAICLEDYRVGEVVVWNCVPKCDCPHVYHRDCMIDYLVTYRGEGSPCPSCRRSYLYDSPACPSGGGALSVVDTIEE